MHVGAIIVSAGRGTRFGAPKHEAQLAGRPVLEWSLQAFQDTDEIRTLVLVLRRGESGEDYPRRFPKISAVVEGGAERQDSVRAGFAALTGTGTDMVLVHDGVRPLIRPDLIRRVIRAAAETGAAVPVIPVPDTLKEVVGERVRSTLHRDRYVFSQTPQGFRYELLAAALTAASREGFSATDEAALVERLGRPVAVVPGEKTNIKITTPADLKMAEAYLAV